MEYSGGDLHLSYCSKSEEWNLEESEISLLVKQTSTFVRPKYRIRNLKSTDWLGRCRAGHVEHETRLSLPRMAIAAGDLLRYRESCL
jgi:hypothetical protein